MPNNPSYLEFLAEWLSPLGRISFKSMFGGHCLYCDGTVFALVANNVLFLKADDVNRPQFESLGLRPFRPFPDKPESMNYYPPPADFFEDADVMKKWAGGAVEAGRRGTGKKRSRKR